MSNVLAGQQYLVTNIKFTHSQHGTIPAGEMRYDDFQMPTDIETIQGWLEDFSEVCTDKQAYGHYVRSILFYNFNMTYDFQLLGYVEPADKPIVYQATYADLADCTFTEFQQMPVSFNIPTAYVATLTDEDIQFADTDDIEQMLFEHMMRQLPIDINVYSWSEFILENISDLMTETKPNDAADPDNIAQYVLDYIPVGVLTDQQEQQLYEIVHSFASLLVKDIGQYK